MASELQTDHLSGKNVYFLLRNSSGQVWNGSAFVAYATGDYADYDIAASEQGTASGYYTADMPSVSADTYNVVAKERLGGAAAETDPTVGTGRVDWSGTAVTANVDTYQAKVWLIDDDTNGVDRYLVIFFKNGQPVISGITSPDLWVYTSAAADLVGTSAAPESLTEIGTSGTYRYHEATDRISDGTAYVARVRATIAGASRSWFQPVGRDS